MSAALGEFQSILPEENINITLPAVKFPSKRDELENVKLFRRCCGPLAATMSGRKKLEAEGACAYGDGRPLFTIVEFQDAKWCIQNQRDSSVTGTIQI